MEKGFSKTIAYALFIAGMISNTIGLVVNLLYGCSNWLSLLNITSTAVSLLLILVPGIFAFKKGYYLGYSKYAVLITAWFSFPIILLTSPDGVFLMYVCLLGPAFGLLATNRRFITSGIATVFIFDAILILKVIFNIQVDTEYLKKNLFHLLGSLTATYLFSLYATAYSTKRFFETIKNLEFKSSTDALTGALNRNSLTSDELRDSGILMIDIDHFKRINDIYGHLNGDKSLQFLVSTLKSNIRKDDRVIRFGGEEFIIVLKGLNNINKLKAVAENIRLKVATFSRVEPSIKAPFTISIGGCLWKEEASLDDNIKVLDSYLYVAKHAGRNATYIQE